MYGKLVWKIWCWLIRFTIIFTKVNHKSIGDKTCTAITTPFTSEKRFGSEMRSRSFYFPIRWKNKIGLWWYSPLGRLSRGPHRASGTWKYMTASLSNINSLQLKYPYTGFCVSLEGEHIEKLPLLGLAVVSLFFFLRFRARLVLRWWHSFGNQLAFDRIFFTTQLKFLSMIGF